MAILQDILYKVNLRSLVGNSAVVIADLQIDSRKVNPGSAFIAIVGSDADGHDFIQKAIDNKAAAIICSRLPDFLSDDITYVEVADSGAAAAAR